ncbi:signal transduction histidine kinase [Mucilaginibacter rubeus]|uniref:sensor histidine kinase n=1 Tax=Mucilaginibacter rubeus TaxID=2027860 RepID=UPI0033952807
MTELKKLLPRIPPDNPAVIMDPVDQPIIVRVDRIDGLFRLAVTDHGIGIPEEKQGFVFDRFFRVHENSQHYAGLGMELYICAQIIHQHNGEIGLVSEEGSGSTLWFSLPDTLHTI